MQRRQLPIFFSSVFLPVSKTKKRPVPTRDESYRVATLFASGAPICRRGSSGFSIGGRGPGLLLPLCRGPLTMPNRHSLVRMFNRESACGSEVHSFFCSERRLTPYPARFAPLEDYYSPSQPLTLFDFVTTSISRHCGGCQVSVADGLKHRPKPSQRPVNPTPQPPLRLRPAGAGWCGRGTAAAAADTYSGIRMGWSRNPTILPAQVSPNQTAAPLTIRALADDREVARLCAYPIPARIGAQLRPGADFSSVGNVSPRKPGVCAPCGPGNL